MESSSAEQALLEEAIGRRGRLISRDPYGRGVIAGFEVDDDGASQTWFVDTSGESVPEETGFVVRSGDAVRARVWMHPADPRLPTLPVAATGESAARLLELLGVEGTVESEIVAYRPGKRAVLRLRGDDGERFLKIVTPDATERIAQLHTALAKAGVPVPRVAGRAAQGCLLIEGAEGVAGPKAATELAPDVLLQAVDVVRVGLERAEVSGAARPALASRIDWYAARLAAASPARAGVAMAVRAGVHRRRRDVTLPVVVHGDLHLGQLFFTGDAVTGLIDVDTAGVGDRDEDSAAFIGHARTSALLTEAAGRSEAAVALHVLADVASDRWLDGPHSRALTAAHLLAHALSAVQQGAEDRADRMLDEAASLVGVAPTAERAG
ncbi:phosphotransferase [Agrococcus sp. SGAir0287]|uniref:phosphotransferase n=1 Tax=Agrococcus sp. SGAir0287 TaxID=2070347 RepID=UPI0010CD0093|nr:phosphotransferase [Agrococcus sp. SGAir0287]QCR20207.1 hypothetical protein C1N71_12805 [Agrococcus sp. SGAir0287]